MEMILVLTSYDCYVNDVRIMPGTQAFNRCYLLSAVAFWGLKKFTSVFQVTRNASLRTANPHLADA